MKKLQKDGFEDADGNDFYNHEIDNSKSSK
jgi:hypothetical protein